MNIFIAGEDGRLAELLRGKLRDGDAVRVVEPDNFIQLEKGSRPHALVVADCSLAAETMGDMASTARRRNPNVMLIAILAEHRAAERALVKECLSDGWHVLSSDLTGEQAAERIAQLLHGGEAVHVRPRNGLVQMIGSTPNIGTTVAAYGVAVQMARLTQRNVAYVCLNLKSSKIHHYLGDAAPAVTLDSLRAELSSGSLDADMLRKACRTSRDMPNFWVLCGNLQREQAEYYSLAEVNCLLDAAKSAFDFCIVDTSAYWDNAGTVGAMLQAGQRIAVTTPQLSHFQEDMNRWLHALAPMVGLGPADFDLLVTQAGSSAPYRAREVAREARISRIGEMRHLPGIEHQLAAGRLAECVTDDGLLGQDCARIARAILTLHGEPYSERRKAKDAAPLPRPKLSWPVFGRRAGLVRK